jgi:hypothetical protein
MRRLLMAGAMFCALASSANAVTIGVNDIGATGTTTINGIVDPGPVVVPGLHGTLGLTYDGAVTNGNGTQTWTFDYSVTNNSSAPTTQSRIASFGFATTPNVVANSLTSTGLFNLALTNTNGFPNVGGADAIIEMCFSAGNNACSGGGGLFIGQTAVGQFTLTFASAQTSISLDDALFRWQDITTPGFATSGVGINNDVQINPLAAVPGPVAGAGIPGLIAACGMLIGFAKRRRQRLATA